LVCFYSCGPDWTNPENFSYSIYLLVSAFVVPVIIIVSSSIILIVILYGVSS
jgi:hypothetical protein